MLIAMLMSARLDRVRVENGYRTDGGALSFYTYRFIVLLFLVRMLIQKARFLG